MFQKVLVIGNLGSDPELRYSPNGKAYVRFPIAANRVYTNAEGEQVKETTWFRVTVWGKQAEVCNQYLAKGRRVLVEADRISAYAYLNKDNQPAASLEITAQNVRFMDSGGGNGANGGASNSATGGVRIPVEELAGEGDADALPF